MSRREPEKALTTGLLLKRFLIVLGLVVVSVAVFIWVMPKGYNDNLALVGSGKNTLVLGYDDGVVQSGAMIEVFNKVRDHYQGRVEFLVADVNTGPGQQFQRRYNIQTDTALLFAADGRLLASVVWPQTPESLQQAINQAFHYQ